MSVEMIRCEKCGSFYNKAKDVECPYCNGVQGDIDKTMPIMPEVTAPTNTGRALDEDKTMPIFPVEVGVDPVVGWLVCVSGSEKGRDYKIHAENNYIGRSEKMDICIRGDETLSRENHATITYDSMDKAFYFAPGSSRSIVRLNGKALLMTAELKAYDKIMLGTTELIFVPLCNENFDWDKIEASER